MARRQVKRQSAFSLVIPPKDCFVDCSIDFPVTTVTLNSPLPTFSTTTGGGLLPSVTSSASSPQNPTSSSRSSGSQQGPSPVSTSTPPASIAPRYVETHCYPGQDVKTWKVHRQRLHPPQRHPLSSRRTDQTGQLRSQKQLLRLLPPRAEPPDPREIPSSRTKPSQGLFLVSLGWLA